MNSFKNFLITFLLYALLLSLCNSKSIPPAVEGSAKDTDKPADPEPSECPLGMEKVFVFNVNGVVSHCQCQEGSFFYKAENTCFSPYYQSPCKENEYSVPSEDGKELLCQENPCKESGVVPFNGTCYKVNERGPCDKNFVLNWNSAALKLDCIFSLRHTAPSAILIVPKKCGSGTLNSGGKCREVL